MIKSIYVIGSLRNPEIPKFANELQAQGFEAFADWYSPGPQADDYWRDYANARGLSYGEALKSYAAKHVFEFDKSHLDRCDAVVLLMPGGKSAHLELGYTIGRGKPGYILFDQEPERYDVMVQFATGVFFSKEDLFAELKKQNQENEFIWECRNCDRRFNWKISSLPCSTGWGVSDCFACNVKPGQIIPFDCKKSDCIYKTKCIS